MNTTLRISLLDSCSIAPGNTAAGAVCDMTEVAVRADRLGFSRFWLSEHHSSTIGHASPELLVPVVAGMTEQIRVGTAGILLSFRSPLAVANDFRLLSTLFPGRIDLGLGRGLVPEHTADALLYGRPKDVSSEGYARAFDDVIRFLTGEVPPEHPHYKAWVSPARLDGAMPEVFGLGSSRTSMQLAAKYGSSFSYALFIKGGGDDPQIFDDYRRAFQPGVLGGKPYTVLGVAGVCADSEQEAKEILNRDSDGQILVNVIGSVEQVRTQLLELADRYHADEIVFRDLARPLTNRLRTCDRLASIFCPSVVRAAA